MEYIVTRYLQLCAKVRYSPVREAVYKAKPLRGLTSLVLQNKFLIVQFARCQRKKVKPSPSQVFIQKDADRLAYLYDPEEVARFCWRYKVTFDIIAPIGMKQHIIEQSLTTDNPLINCYFSGVSYTPSFCGECKDKEKCIARVKEKYEQSELPVS